MAEITLPVSLGEALDKLTILDIKLEKIADHRRADVQKEYSVLMTSLKPYVDQFAYHYRILREVNLAIWDIQDRVHGKDTGSLDVSSLYRDILLENDRRFRVKAKINTAANSALREQKGYAKKRAFIYTHLGLGDMFWMNGAVRYLATAFDEVTVVCKEKYKANVTAMYADDPTIKLLIIKDDADLHPWPSRRAFLEEEGYTVFGCGFFAPKEEKQLYNLPESFYADLGLSHDFRTRYFHAPKTAAAAELAAKFKDTPYSVVHEESSVKKLPVAAGLKAAGETRLILDLNKNQYESTHAFWGLAELVVNKPLSDYTWLLEGAAELHMIESSIYCMASHLDLSRVKRRVCYEPWGGNAERLGLFETGEAFNAFQSKEIA